jgi:hypothetical protein
MSAKKNTTGKVGANGDKALVSAVDGVLKSIWA